MVSNPEAVPPTPGEDPRTLIPWRLLADQTPTPTILVDADGVVLHCSASFDRMVGGNPGAVLGARLGELTHLDDRADLRSALAHVGDGSVRTRVVRLCFADCGWHQVRLQVQPLGPTSGWCIISARDESADLTSQAGLLRRTELQLLLDRVNGTFVSSPTANTDEVIVEALEAIGRHLGADRAYVLSYDFEERTESMSHEWASPGTDPEIATYQDISFDTVPSGIIRSLRGEVVAVQAWDEAGPEWELDRQFLEAEGILSTIELPISRHGQVVGSVGFDWTTAHGTWSLQDLEVLRMFASSISQLLTHRDHRAHLQRQLDESQARFATLVDNIPDPVMRVGVHGEVLFANAAARRQLLLDERGRLREDEAVWSELRAAQEQALATLEEQVVAYRIEGATPRHFETRIVPELDEFGQPRSLLLLSTDIGTRSSR